MEAAADGDKLWIRCGPGLWRWLSDVCKGDPGLDMPNMKLAIADAPQASAGLARQLRRTASMASAGSARANSKRAKLAEAGPVDLQWELEVVVDEKTDGGGCTRD